MAAVGRLNFPKALREIRIHLCQTSKSSQGVRYNPTTGSEIHTFNAQSFPEFQNLFYKSKDKICVHLDFLEKYYVGLKKENPRFPFLVRECSGIQPKIYACYGFGNETSVTLADKNCDEVFQEMDKLVKAQS